MAMSSSHFPRNSKTIGTLACATALASACIPWWSRFLGLSSKGSSEWPNSLILVLCYLMPYSLLYIVGQEFCDQKASNSMYRVWALILGGVNTTASAIALDAIGVSGAYHNIISRVLLGFELASITLTFNIHAWHNYWCLYTTDCAHLFYVQRCIALFPHLVVCGVCLAKYTDKFWPMHLGTVLTALSLSVVTTRAVLTYYAPSDLEALEKDEQKIYDELRRGVRPTISA